MVVSSSDRDDLVLRVERALARTPRPARARRALVRAAVDRTLGALAERTAHPAPAPAQAAAPSGAARWGAAILASAAIPDLASRARRALEAAGVRPLAVTTAQAGRHTVVVLQVQASDEAGVRAVARAIGASCAWRGGFA